MNSDGLRVFVEDVDREVSRVASGGDALRASWAKLVGFLALGPAPVLRDCPSCGRSGMHDAKVCGYCWEKLPARETKGQVE